MDRGHDLRGERRVEEFAAALSDAEVSAEKSSAGSTTGKSQIPEATLYTALEPCTKEVLSDPLKCCTELIKQLKFKRVFIGILDPNHGIDVELFPPEIVRRIRALNQDFIRTQQIGIQFGNIESGQTIRTRDKKGRGTPL